MPVEISLGKVSCKITVIFVGSSRNVHADLARTARKKREVPNFLPVTVYFVFGNMH